MILNEFLSSCQNQFKGLFGRNEDFRVILSFEENCGNLEKKEYVMYSNYFEDPNYLNKYRLRKIIFWEMRYSDKLYIDIEGSY